MVLEPGNRLFRWGGDLRHLLSILGTWSSRNSDLSINLLELVIWRCLPSFRMIQNDNVTSVQSHNVKKLNYINFLDLKNWVPTRQTESNFLLKCILLNLYMLLVLFYINFSQFAGLPLGLLFSWSKFYYLDFIGLQLWMLGPSVGSSSCRQFPVFLFFLVPPCYFLCYPTYRWFAYGSSECPLRDTAVSPLCICSFTLFFATVLRHDNS